MIRLQKKILIRYLLSRSFQLIQSNAGVCLLQLLYFSATSDAYDGFLRALAVVMATPMPRIPLKKTTSSPTPGSAVYLRRHYEAILDGRLCSILTNSTKHCIGLLSDIQVVPPPGELHLNIASCLILAHWPNVRKTCRHP